MNRENLGKLLVKFFYIVRHMYGNLCSADTNSLSTISNLGLFVIYQTKPSWYQHNNLP